MHQLSGIHIYCKRLEQTRQSPEMSSTLCQKRLSANHISISTHFRIRLAISSRKTENLSLDAALQSHQWLGGHPWTNLNTHQDVLDRHCGPDTFIILHSRVDAYKFSFFQELFQTGTPFPVQPDQHHLWTPSRRPYTVYLASQIVITEPCHSSSKGCTPMAGYSLKNWSIFKLNGPSSSTHNCMLWVFVTSS